MGVTFRASAQSTAIAPTVPITIPSSVQTGDALLVAFYTGNVAVTAVPVGWTEAIVVSQPNIKISLYWKVAIAGDAGSTISWECDPFDGLGLLLLAYSGTDALTPIESVVGGAATGTVTTPAVTTTAPDEMFAAFFGYWANPLGSVDVDDNGINTVREATFPLFPPYGGQYWIACADEPCAVPGAATPQSATTTNPSQIIVAAASLRPL